MRYAGRMNDIGIAMRFSVVAAAMLGGAIFARGAAPLVYEGKDGPGRGKHVVLLAGDEEYRSEECLPMLARILAERHGFTCSVVFSVNAETGEIDPLTKNHQPGLDALDRADAVVMFLRFRAWPDEQMKHFADAYRRGVPFVAIRTSTHAFQFPGTAAHRGFNDFGKNVLGERWVNHWGRHKVEATRAVVEPGAADDPILRGVTGVFGNTDVYEAYPPADAKILLRGQVLKGMHPDDPPADYRRARSTDKVEQGINDPMMPVAWTRLHRNEAGVTNRILTTTMGSGTDFENEGLRRLIVNGVFWAIGLDVPAAADVTVAGGYKGSMYGFGGFKKGLRPSDFAPSPGR